MTIIILLDTCAVVDFIFGMILNEDIEIARRQGTRQGRRVDPFFYNRTLRICKIYLDWSKCCRAWLEGKSKRHPAFEVENLIEIKKYLNQNGVTIKEDDKIPGINRFSFFDYWGNRIEFIEKD